MQTSVTWINDSKFPKFGAAPAPRIPGLDNTLEHVIRQPRNSSGTADARRRTRKAYDAIILYDNI